MQDISLFWNEQRVDRSSEPKGFAEIKAADLVLVPPDRRLCILGRDVGAVLTASFVPVVPIQSIDTDVCASHNIEAVPRGLRGFRRCSHCASDNGLSPLPAHTGEISIGLMRDRWIPEGPPKQGPGGNKKVRGMS